MPTAPVAASGDAMNTPSAGLDPAMAVVEHDDPRPAIARTKGECRYAAPPFYSTSTMDKRAEMIDNHTLGGKAVLPSLII